MAYFQKYIKEFNSTLNRTIWYVPTPGIKYIKGGKEKDHHKISQIYKLKDGKYDEYYKRMLSVFQSHFWRDADTSDRFMTYFYKIMKGSNSDKSVYKKLRDFYLKLNYFYDEPDRGQNISYNIFDKIILDYVPTNYMDFGCFDGAITKAIGKYYELPKDAVNGIDIIDYDKREDITFKLFEDDIIPYDNETFDLITCLMTLHHVDDKKLDVVLNEIYRVMTTGGYLIIKEHNVNPKDKYMMNVLNIQHDMYDHVLKEPTWGETKINYLSMEIWNKKLENIGFKSDQTPAYNNNAQYNPFNKYIKAYKKIGLNQLYKCM